MIVEAQITIQAAKEAVWAALTDLEHAADILGGVMKTEILEKPAKGLVGLKWTETRMLFGKAESVDKWITEAVDGVSFDTRAEAEGFVFTTHTHITESGGVCTVVSAHETRAVTFGAKLKSLPMVFFKGAIRKAILKDLTDVKTAVERASSD